MKLVPSLHCASILSAASSTNQRTVACRQQFLHLDLGRVVLGFNCALNTPSTHRLKRKGLLSRVQAYRSMDSITIRSQLEEAGQVHLLQGADALTADQQEAFLEQLKTIDLQYVNNIFKASMETAQAVQPAQPVDDVMSLEKRTADDIERWRHAGLEMIAEGKLAILLLAGGQGTRLGSSAPKGCYNIGLPSGKSLFQLQAERVLRLQQLAEARQPLRWYIMTSKATDAATRANFEENNYFGLKAEQVMFFQQGMLPALTPEGKIVLEAAGKVSMAPDGNGGLYRGLSLSGALEDMKTHGIEAVDTYCVDNALARLGDPVFAGFCKELKTDCGARVVARAGPEEKVGVFARRNGALEVVEYSEMDPKEAEAVDEATGVLRYNWANICMHYFSRTWLEQVADDLAVGSRYHIARKNIPSISGPVPGIKLELFIFDTFPSAKRTALFEVVRSEEFAPVKNAPGSNTDSPDTARQFVMQLHTKWVIAAGGKVESEEGVEIAPTVSYAGEGLGNLVEGKTYTNGLDAALQGTA